MSYQDQNEEKCLESCRMGRATSTNQYISMHFSPRTEAAKARKKITLGSGKAMSTRQGRHNLAEIVDKPTRLQQPSIYIVAGRSNPIGICCYMGCGIKAIILQVFCQTSECCFFSPKMSRSGNMKPLREIAKGVYSG
jgi:hypothetical protein